MPPKKRFVGPKLVMNVFNTQYQVIIDTAKELGFKTKICDPGLNVNPY